MVTKPDSLLRFRSLVRISVCLVCFSLLTRMVYNLFLSRYQKVVIAFKLLICLGSGRCLGVCFPQPRIYQCTGTKFHCQPLGQTFFPLDTLFFFSESLHSFPCKALTNLKNSQKIIEKAMLWFFT